MPVFLSYSHQDQELVRTIALSLSNNDVKVLRDGDRILPGDRFAQEIEKWIGSATCACIFISGHSLASPWVTREIDACLERQARDPGFAIIPVLLDNSTLPAALEQLVFIDLRNGVETALPRMLSVIRAAEQASAQGRVNPWGTAYFDFGVHGEFDDKNYALELDIVSYDSNESYSILSQFVFRGMVDQVWKKLDFDDPKLLQNHLLKTCAEAFIGQSAMTTITTHKVRRARFTLSSESGEECIEVSVRATILGPGPKGAVAFNWGALFPQICSTLGITFEGDAQAQGSLGKPVAGAADAGEPQPPATLNPRETSPYDTEDSRTHSPPHHS